MRWWLPLLVCPALSGCFGFAYPSFSETPAVNVKEGDVRAFRVLSEWTLSGPCITGPGGVWHSIEEIPVIKKTVERQQDSYLAYYYMIFPVLNGSRSRTLTVLLYRPGYETVEIPSRSLLGAFGETKRAPVVWKEAVGLEAQEKAVERIIGPFPGSWLGQEALRFAAQEYARLADSPFVSGPGKEKERERLRAKAKEYEALAAQRAK
jgi:hypothetical protein